MKSILVNVISDTTVIPVDVFCSHSETEEREIDVLDFETDEMNKEIWEVCVKCQEPVDLIQDCVFEHPIVPFHDVTLRDDGSAIDTYEPERWIE